jgi:hypothetical protein
MGQRCVSLFLRLVRHAEKSSSQHLKVKIDRIVQYDD